MTFPRPAVTLRSSVCPDDGASGQAPAVCGPSQRQRAVGSGEQNRRDPARGHRDLTLAPAGHLLTLTLIREQDAQGLTQLYSTRTGIFSAQDWNPSPTL